MFKGLFGGTDKDAVPDTGTVRVMINLLLKRYAQLEDLRISDDGVRAAVRMLGETDTIDVHVGDVEFSEDGTAVILRQLASNRPWLDNLMQDFVEGRTIPLSPEAAAGMALLKPLVDR